MTPTTEKPRAVRRERSHALIGVVCALWLAGCAGLAQEHHLAPLYTRISSAGGGVDFEAVGGVLRAHHDRDQGLDFVGVLPLYSWRRHANDDRSAWFIPPLGSYKKRERETVWQFLPLARYSTAVDQEGRPSWSLYTIPFFYWRKDPDGRMARIFFPLAGTFEHFFSVDRGSFFLFPLFMKLERHGRTALHILFPIFTWRWGEGGYSWRIWPLIGRNVWQGRYDRWFFLWPFFHFQKNRELYTPGNQGDAWALFPLVSKRRSGDWTAYSFLWPFFGYGSSSETDAWAWDGPWPLVRIAKPASDAEQPVHHYRFWPFYSHFEGDGLQSNYVLWPLFNWRKHEYRSFTTRSQNFALFWHSSDREHVSEGKSHTRRAWPFFRREWSRSEDYCAFPALNPFWRIPVIDDHYAWIWQLFRVRRDNDRISERSMLGLWRRERDEDEDRRSITGLWAQRTYSRAGQRVRETSLLFGLLRFRSHSTEGVDWMAPAFPGPGWPLARVPNSIQLEGRD